MTHMSLTSPLFSLQKNENYRIDVLIIKKNISAETSHACTYYAIFTFNINSGEQKNNTFIFCKTFDWHEKRFYRKKTD